VPNQSLGRSRTNARVAQFGRTRKHKSGKQAFLCLLGTMGLSAVGATESLEYLPVGILVISVVGVLLSVPIGFFSRNFAAARLWGLAATVSFFAVLVGSLISDKRRDTSQQTAGQIIEAIERYRSTYGTLPASLDQLVPEQLPQLPITSDGRPFWYQVTSNNFRVSFPLPAMMVRTYDSRTRDWRTHD
jgi:hypothetical protein